MGGTPTLQNLIALPKGYVSDDSFKMVHGTDALHDFDVGAGKCRDTGDTNDIVVAALTKQIDQPWAVGNNAGGLDATPPITADAVGALWSMLRPDTGVTDLLYSESFTAPTLPTNYTKKQLVGMFWVDGSSEIRPMIHIVNYFRLKAPVNDVNDATITNGAFETGTLSIPRNCLGHIVARVNNATTTNPGGRLFVRTKGATDTFTEEHAWIALRTGSAFDDLSSMGLILVDESSQVEYATDESDGSAQVDIRSLGCIMLTRGAP